MRKYQVRFRGGITEKEHSYLAGILPDTTDGRKLALDQRLLNPALPDDPGSKANACADKVYEIWAQTRERRSTQLIFSDLATPGTGAWNVYDDIRDKLIARGVPKEEIAYIHDANTDAKKAALFARVRAGKVRVLLGSTQKMGAGTNVQTKLIALHHLDVPWRPSDIEQREGRILRQGNENKRVQIFRYATEGSFDAYSWQLIENKQRYISQIMTSKTPARSCEDLDEATLTFVSPSAQDTASSISKMLGDETILTGSTSKSDGKTTSSHQLMGRPLVSPAQMVRIERDTWIVEKAGYAPMKTHLEGYWKYLSLTAEDAIKEPESDYQEVRLLSVTDMQQALQYSADLAPAEHKSKLAANSKKRKHRNQNAELYPGKFDT